MTGERAGRTTEETRAATEAVSRRRETRSAARCDDPGTFTFTFTLRSADYYGAFEHAHAALEGQGACFVGGDDHVYGLFQGEGLLNAGFWKHDLVGAGGVRRAGEAQGELRAMLGFDRGRGEAALVGRDGDDLVPRGHYGFGSGAVFVLVAGGQGGKRE